MGRNPFLSTLVQNAALRGTALFLGLLIAFWLTLHQQSVRERLATPFTAVIASQAAWIIDLIGVEAHHDGVSIYGDGFSVDVKDGCNAVYEIGLFLSAVIATPSSPKHKLLGAIAGPTAIYLFNLLRVVALFLTGVYCKELFSVVHDHASQSILIFFVVVLWLLWASGAIGRASPK
jgi:exosortase H (IPTLxxWG-CTERM-specific)